jgi:signal peptidase I
LTPPIHHRDGFLVHAQALLEIIVVATFVATFIVQPYRIPSASMQPTLLAGDFLLGNKQAFAPAGALDKVLPPTMVHRGDLVIFHFPPDPSIHLVKRVIGLPGDRLRLRHGRVLLNGQSLAEPYAVYSDVPPDSFRDDFPSLRNADPNVDPAWWATLRHIIADNEITVPPNNFFVMGDNRNDSEDSRYWGFVPREAIVARPLAVYFSVASPPPASDTLLTRLRAMLRGEAHSFRILR